MTDEETLGAGAPLSLAELLPSNPRPRGTQNIFKCPVPGALKCKIKHELMHEKEVHELQQEERDKTSFQVPAHSANSNSAG